VCITVVLETVAV